MALGTVKCEPGRRGVDQVQQVNAQVPFVTLLLMCAGHDQVRAYIKQLKETMDLDAMQQQQ